MTITRRAVLAGGALLAAPAVLRAQTPIQLKVTHWLPPVHQIHKELTRWSARDVARGRLIDTPSAGTVAGISARGELLVRGPDDVETAHRSGTLTFAEPLACS